MLVCGAGLCARSRARAHVRAQRLWKEHLPSEVGHNARTDVLCFEHCPLRALESLVGRAESLVRRKQPCALLRTLGCSAAIAICSAATQLGAAALAASLAKLALQR